MKKTTSDTKQTASVAAVMGDDRLALEWSAMLESCGFTVLPVNDTRAIAHASARITAAFELTILSSDEKKTRLHYLDAHLPASVPLISTSVCMTALAQTQWVKHRERLVGFSGFPTFSGAPLVDIAPTLYTSDTAVRAVRDLFASLNKETVCVQDRTGMIVPGVIAQIVNEALMAVQQNVASAHDIDTAMKLGAGYPLGPIEWGEKIGFATIAALLDARRNETGEERWRTCALLRQLSVVGTFWSGTHAPHDEPIQEELALAAQPENPGTAENTEKPKRRAKKTSAAIGK